MLPSFTVPKPPESPRKELRLDHTPVPVSNSSDCSICQMPLSPVRPSCRSPRKPRYEFCVSTAIRGPAVAPVQAPAALAVPQMPLGEARLETPLPVFVGFLLSAQITCGYSLPY